ncbi:MAG TPA: hypothetical protein VF407_04925 [Polyangiaceae bacterium]
MVPAPRPQLPSLDADSTGPATPYTPNSELRPSLFDPQPASGVRARKKVDPKLVVALVLAYVFGAATASAIFLSLR